MDTGQVPLGTNMYVYCLNDPINFVDPDGFRARTIQEQHQMIARRDENLRRNQIRSPDSFPIAMADFYWLYTHAMHVAHQQRLADGLHVQGAYWQDFEYATYVLSQRATVDHINRRLEQVITGEWSGQDFLRYAHHGVEPQAPRDSSGVGGVVAGTTVAGVAGVVGALLTFPVGPIIAVGGGIIGGLISHFW